VPESRRRHPATNRRRYLWPGPARRRVPPARPT
jgi:hypothetical protein